MAERPVVLTVCLGNICRSPTAAAAIAEASAQAGVEVEVSSAGTGDWHLGSPPDRRMRAAAADEGLTLDGTAEQVDARRLADADLVLVMDHSNLADVQRLADAAGVEADIRLLREFDPQAQDDLEVPDPYYGGPDGFTEVVAIARRTAAEVVAHLTPGRDQGPTA
ncbi:MAG: low molecular weight protein-tyrosine-phosphatase [Nitriliruptoraceae bacterium]